MNNRVELVSNLLEAGNAGKDGFVSTYSFPRGHTDDGDNIPKIDTIFIDFDVPADSEYRERNRTLDAWKRSMSDLLIRVQLVAEAIIAGGKQEHWRASLSGHKGIHLFFDFEPVDVANGSYTQFKRGLEKYGDQMIAQLDEIAGGINIDPWVDVDSSDLARLVRHPNTPHPGAEHREETSWCVPVSIEELVNLSPDDYLELTSGPRPVPVKERTPSAAGRREVALEVRNASGGEYHSERRGSVKDPKAVKRYEEESNDRIKVSDIPLLVANKPCIMEFVKRNDSYNYGSESRIMEINVMKELIQKKVPIDVIVNFFRPIEGFSEGTTRSLVEDLISRYEGPFVCQNVWDAGGEFCVGMNDRSDESCRIYENEYVPT
ncbi:hypothetical protein [Hardygib1 virus]|nr:hypothetical protein [Hardygib1 virus]